jgi:hypothetical protein
VFGNVEGISAVDDGDRWRAVLHTVMYILVSYERCVFRTPERFWVFQGQPRCMNLCGCFVVVGKGKGHPRTGNEPQKGSRSIVLAVSLTSVVDGSWWSSPRPGRFTPGKDPVPIV